MTEQSLSEFNNFKIQAPTAETQKRKKSSKKKANEKTSNVRSEALEDPMRGLNPEANFDLVHYTMKLEREVLEAKKRLKSQRRKFREIIKGLAKHFDAKGIGSEDIQEYIQNLGPRIAENDEIESNYEKFFTVHKYHIAEDSNNKAKQIPLSGQRVENHSNENISKLNMSDSLKPLENFEEKEKKKGRKSSKTIELNGEEAPKKRKYTKKNKQVEEEQKVQITESEEIQEIPPFQITKETPTKSEPKVKKVEDTLKNYEEVLPHQQYGVLGTGRYVMNDNFTSFAKQMNPAMLNYYASNPGNFDISDEIYSKLFQELLKSNMGFNIQNPSENGRKEMMNHFQGSFK